MITIHLPKLALSEFDLRNLIYVRDMSELGWHTPLPALTLPKLQKYQNQMYAIRGREYFSAIMVLYHEGIAGNEHLLSNLIKADPTKKYEVRVDDELKWKYNLDPKRNYNRYSTSFDRLQLIEKTERGNRTYSLPANQQNPIAERLNHEQGNRFFDIFDRMWSYHERGLHTDAFNLLSTLFLIQDNSKKVVLKYKQSNFKTLDVYTHTKILQEWNINPFPE
jgi:hypothetical protein